MQRFNTKIVLLGLIVFLSGAASAFVFKDNTNPSELKDSINHSELFELKRNCASLARNFVDKKSEEQSHTLWSVLVTNYNIQHQSCFGEFNVIAYPSVPGQTFSEDKIYDLLTGQQIQAFTNPPSSENSDIRKYAEYAITAQPLYEKARQDIFGSTKSARP